MSINCLYIYIVLVLFFCFNTSYIKEDEFQLNEFFFCFVFSGYMTVYINGMASEVPRGPIDMKAMFGLDVMLVNSNGELVPMNEYGILLQGLQMGESYFLVSYT